MGLAGSRQAVSTNIKNCTLWKSDRSPCCRAVMMALDAMNLNVSEVDVNMDKGEHKTAEMRCLNPLQTLPVLRDKELVLYDSHAICAYLASRYCDSGRFLPKDAGGCALVNQQMHYNSGVLYPRFRCAADPILYENCHFVMPQQVCDIESAYGDLENMLAARTYFGGSWPTLGDITIGATVSTLHALVPIDKLRFPRLSCWMHRLSEEKFYITANKRGLVEFTRRIGELQQLQKS